MGLLLKSPQVKLLDSNAMKALIASGGLTASDEGSYVELWGYAGKLHRN